jgi:DNA (cytosine-5)-methyltransferase 1
MDFETETFLVQPVAFNARQDPDHWHDRIGPLDTDGSTQAVSYAIQAGALRTNPASGPDGVGVQADHAYTLEARAEVQAVAFAENSRAEVRLEGGDGQRCGALSTGGGKPGQGVPMVAVQASQSGVRLNETVGTLDANYGSRRHNGVMSNMQVRRLTPVECARLQGFPDDYLDILYRGKPAADGPKYKALGNSWAVPVVRWIGERIQEAA